MAGEFQATLASGLEAYKDPVEEKKMLLRAEQESSLQGQRKQQEIAHNFLKQFGIVKEEDVPFTSDELMKSISDFGKKNGSMVNFNIAPDTDEESKVKFLQQLHDAYKIPMPAKKSVTTFDAERAKELGATLSSKGEASLSPLKASRSGDVGVYAFNPITGEVEQKASVPFGSKTYKAVMTPDQIKERSYSEAQGKAIGKNIETSDKLAGAVKRLAILNKQFKDALPTGDRTPLEQRIAGKASTFAAKMGLTDNPKLVALQKNIRPMAINMIRAFGEVGNLSESEQQGAIDVVEQSGLTDSERIEATRQFIEFALAGASPEGIKHLKSREDIQGILDAFGVNLPEDGSPEKETNTNTESVGTQKQIGRFQIEVE